MLKSSFHFDDFKKPLFYEKGVFRFGKSSIDPYKTNFLEHFAITCGHRTLIVVREKSAHGEKNISNPITNVEIHQYEYLRKSLANWALGILLIEINNEEKTFLFKTGGYCPAPLYFLINEDTVSASWNPKDFLNKTSLDHLDLEECAFFIEDEPYGHKTIFNNIYKLPYKGAFLFSEDDFEILYPPEEEFIRGREAINETVLVNSFIDCLQQTLERWPLKENGISCELSGGFDSAFISIMLRHLLPQEKLLTGGIIFEGKCREQQIQRRQELINKFYFSDVTVDFREHMPLSEVLTKPNKARWYDPPTTQTAYQPTWRKLKELGATTVFTGLGGDELTILSFSEKKFLNIPEVKFTNSPDLPPLLNESYAQKERPKHWPNMQIPMSTVDSGEGMAIAYLEEGLWPVHPFASTEINKFCRSLPMLWRKDRKILKDALKKFGVSEEYLNPVLKEDMSEAVQISMIKYEEQIRALFKNSILCELGVINPETLPLFLDNLDDVYIAMPLVSALRLECFLQNLA